LGFEIIIFILIAITKCIFDVAARSESEIWWRMSISLIWMVRDLKSDVEWSESWRRIGMGDGGIVLCYRVLCILKKIIIFFIIMCC
jgi:hypothetical protein